MSRGKKLFTFCKGRARGEMERGVTLIELMISLVLGLFTVLVITQVFVVSEGLRRSSTNGSDAQINGALALYSVERDIQMAGYGVASNPAALGCSISARYDGTAVAGFPFVLAPVVIESNGTAGSKISVLFSRKASFSVPMPVTEDHPVGTRSFVVRSSFGTVAGDMFIAVPPVVGGGLSCELLQATNTGGSVETTLSTTRIPHDATSDWNSGDLVNSFSVGGYLLNMGPMVYRTYSVNAELALRTTDFISATGAVSTEDLFPQVVKLQAMYGKDTDSNGVVDTYDTTTPTTAAGWEQVLAIRVAVVARSAQFEREVVTSSAPLWNVGTAHTIAGTSDCYVDSKCLSLGLSHITDWDHYRYKVYDTVIPLRNILWNS